MQLKDFDSQLTRQSEFRTRNRVLFSSVDSTNSVGKRIASSYKRNSDTLAPTVLVALEQTGGRGRLGNRWFSQPGGIYASLIVPAGPQGLSTLPMRVASALCRELETVLDPSCRVKWPNDLIVSGKKIGGVLIETVGSGEKIYAVIGFGINYSNDLMDMEPTATTVLNEATAAPHMAEMAARLIGAVEKGTGNHISTGQVVKEYSQWSLHEMNHLIRCRTSEGLQLGTFLGFDQRGFLRLLTDAGEVSISAGEVIE